MALAHKGAVRLVTPVENVTDASALFDGCDRIDEKINKLAEHEDARCAPVKPSAPDLCVDVEVRLRC